MRRGRHGGKMAFYYLLKKDASFGNMSATTGFPRMSEAFILLYSTGLARSIIII